MSRQPVVMMMPAAGRGAFRLWRSPGILQSLSAKLWLLLLLYATSNVADDFFLLLLVGFLAIVLLIWWGITLMLHFVGTVAGQLGWGIMGRMRFLTLPLIM